MPEVRSKMRTIHHGVRVSVLALLIVAGTVSRAAEKDWEELFGDKPFEAWKSPSEQWIIAADAKLDEKNPRQLVAVPGKGVLLNGPGRVKDLVTKELFTDIEVHVEFMVPKGSNSGIKLNGLYEIQIEDSFGKTKLTGSDCGGIYPRAEDRPRYRTIDEGTPPRVNACKKPGEWQTLDIAFRSPRFDKEGKKTAQACFVKVVLNGQVIHENAEVKYPTGAAWVKKEVEKGPLLLQSDHGPVAFRNVRVRPLTEIPKR
jgi:Domain of Unknown Function (DUF1080)